MAKEYGAEVPFIRPKELAEDDSPVTEVAKHAINFIEKKDRVKYERIYCCRKK